MYLTTTDVHGFLISVVLQRVQDNFDNAEAENETLSKLSSANAFEAETKKSSGPSCVGVSTCDLDCHVGHCKAQSGQPGDKFLQTLRAWCSW